MRQQTGKRGRRRGRREGGGGKSEQREGRSKQREGAGCGNPTTGKLPHEQFIHVIYAFV